jgi:predicted membrane-bound mannosyltransferase/DNA-binding beta-propeller fold protein YncE
MTATTMDNESRNELNTLFSRSVVLNWEIIAYIVIFILAVFTRFYGLGDRVMSHDESLHTVYSHNLYDRGVFEHNPMMHGPILFHFTALNYALFGVDDFSSRIYPALLGVIMVMFPLLFRRWLGRTGAILAALMILISPLLLYYHRYIRHDTPSILAAMVMFYAAMMYLSGPENQRRRAHWLYILAAAMIWNLGSKETAFIYIAIFGAFLTLYWLVRLVQHFFDLNARLIFDTITVGVLLAVVASLGVIVVISISLSDQPDLISRVTFVGDQFILLIRNTADQVLGVFGLGDGADAVGVGAVQQSVSLGFTSFFSWTALTFVVMLAVIAGPALWVYRRGQLRFSLPDALVIALIAVIFILFPSLATALLAAVTVGLIYAVFRIDTTGTFRKPLIILLAVMLVVCATLIFLEELSHQPARVATETALPAVPGEDPEVAVTATRFTALPLVLVWTIAIVSIAGMFVMRARGWWKVLHQFPEFDVLIVMGSLILPWLTAVFIVATQGTPADYAEIGAALGGLSTVAPVTGAEAVGRIFVGLIATIPMLAISTIAGLLWNWRRWLVCAGVFYAIFVFFFTTVFTNIEGIGSGMVYSLQYWLGEQGVRRGSQPQYYYLLIVMPIYEFLPVIGSFLAMIAGMVVFWRRRRPYDEQATQEVLTADVEASAEQEEQPGTTEMEVPARKPQPRLTQVPFLLFVGWWAVLNLFGYTLAGEKMPWLGTHLTLPLILLAGWFFGRVFERIERHEFIQRGWTYLFLLPFLFVGLFQLIAPFLGGEPPFTGTQQFQLSWTYRWLGVLLVVAVVIYVIYRLTAITGWAHLRRMIAVVSFAILAVLTFRTAWMAAFINYDYATEYLVYAHGAPANKRITEELAELSRRTTGGLDARILYDNKFSWPGSWYMRQFPNAVFIGQNPPTPQQLDDAIAVIVGDENRPQVEPLLEDQFQRFDHKRMWWPNQDYFGLNAQRMNDLLNIRDDSASQRRRGMFDIWWARDYSTYGEAVGRDIRVTTWSPSDNVFLFVRKDFAAQVWPYGIGDATVLTPFTEVEVNLCTANWERRAASVVFDTDTQPMLRPLGMSIGPDGRVYVAEEGTHRISVFDRDGGFITSFGQQGAAAEDGAFFERPHSVAVADDGTIYVVDTWNYQIRAFTPEFDFITRWGQPVTGGFDAQPDPTDGFWGPRDAVVDAEGNIYVADTGNKRIRVYDAGGNHLRDIGSGGTGTGQLNEPAGLALHPDGRLYITDTWNRRVSVFMLNGTHLFSFTIRGWYDDMGNRPYLAVDADRELLYVTDPDAGRVLVYDTSGECVGSFGQFNRENPDSTQFAIIGDIAVDDEGNVYVADLGSGRVLRFDPFERPLPEEAEIDDIEDMFEFPGVEEFEEEFTEELEPEPDPLELEVTEEVTEEPAP